MSFPLLLLRLFPFLRWPRPTTASLQRDVWAGISVGLVLVPQALAYATLADMPSHTGLYAAMLPSIVGLLWGSSALLAVGPVALTSILVFGSLSSIATPESSEWVALAIWLALYSGLIQLLLGIFRMGSIANLVSQPVVTGFINAAAVIIMLSQLPPCWACDLRWNIGYRRHGLYPSQLAPRLLRHSAVQHCYYFICSSGICRGGQGY